MKTARFDVLSQREIERIHAASMEILADVGIKVGYDRARERVREILDAHQPRELDPAVEQGLQEYLEMTRARGIEDYRACEDESRQDFGAL